MIEIDFNKSTDGLIPAIVQEHETGAVLMLAYINKDAWEKTLETGTAHYWSRSRNKLWLKGESSGNVQIIKDILIDCDQDTVVYRVEQVGGAACHKGYPSCFYRKIVGTKAVTIGKPVFDPDEVYNKKK
jgi:phosphoribosyl-AMP cyclohydrolase